MLMQFFPAARGQSGFVRASARLALPPA